MASEQGEGYYHLLQGQSCCSRMQLLRGNAPYSDGPYGPFVQLHCNRVAVLLGEAVLVGSDLKEPNKTKVNRWNRNCSL